MIEAIRWQGGERVAEGKVWDGSVRGDRWAVGGEREQRQAQGEEGEESRGRRRGRRGSVAEAECRGGGGGGREGKRG